MKTLLRGKESKERLTLIISLTNIRSEEIIAMMYKIFVDGWSDEDAANMFNVPQPSINRAVKRLNEVSETIEEIKELDWSRFRKSLD